MQKSDFLWKKGLKRAFLLLPVNKVFLIQLNGFQYEKAFKDLFGGYRLMIMHLKCKKVTFCEKGLYKAFFLLPLDKVFASPVEWIPIREGF